MTINYPLSWPTTPGPKRVTFFGINAVSISRSPFTYDTQVQEFAGQSWACEITLPPMEQADAEKWIAFLVSLKGPRGTFMVYDPLSVLPKGVATGTPLVKGAGQTGNTLVTDGWTPDTTGILLAGDKIQIGNRLYMNLQDVNANSSGEATLDIWPRLRETPADNSTIITVRPKGLFRLANPMVNFWGADETKLYDIAISAVEAI